MVGWLKFNIIEKIPFMVYLEIQCTTFKMEKSFIAHPWIQRSVVGLEEYSAHDWRAATSSTARSSYLARVGPVVMTMVDETLTIGESALLSYDLRKTANCNWKANHDDVIKWKHFPRYWPFVRGIHRSPVNSLRKGMWRRDLVFSLIFDLELTVE